MTPLRYALGISAALVAAGAQAAPVSYTDLRYADESSRNLLDIFVPEGTQNAPLVLFVHGGGWLFGSKEVVESPRVGKDRLLDAGFAVASMSYRLAPSPDYPETDPTARETWPAQLEDMGAALQFLNDNGETYGYNADQLALFGESAGGHMVLAAALAFAGDAERDVDAVVSWYPITDVADIDDDREALGIPRANLGAAAPEAYLIGGDVDENPELAAAASPFDMLDDVAPETDLPPFLLMHGLMDTIIPYTQSESFFEKMLAEGRDAELVLLPGGTHAGGTFESDPQTLATVIDFLGAELAPAPVPVPAGLPLLAGGLTLLWGVKRRRRT